KQVHDLEAEVFFIGKNVEININLSVIKYLDITKTGKPYKYKICNVCHILKDYYEDFAINQTDAKGRKTTRPTCRKCRKDIDGVNLKLSEKRRMDEIKPEKYFIYLPCLQKAFN